MTAQVQQSCPRVVFENGCAIDTYKYKNAGIPVAFVAVSVLFVVGTLLRRDKPEDRDTLHSFRCIVFTPVVLVFAAIFWSSLHDAKVHDLCSPTLTPELSVKGTQPNLTAVTTLCRRIRWLMGILVHGSCDNPESIGLGDFSH